MALDENTVGTFLAGGVIAGGMAAGKICVFWVELPKRYWGVFKLRRSCRKSGRRCCQRVSLSLRGIIHGL